ncbi:MAG: TonB-dependent receptor [Pseudomonadales bacterium]|nr:TonB-dependent receptor [Pseudomonadales bacterium]
MTDIQTVELLRGPQGTLYGVNTPAGLLNVNTRRPTDEFEGQFSIGRGNFEAHKVSGFISGGLTDNLAGRLTFWDAGNDGHTELVQGGNTNGFNETGVRAKLLWTPSDTAEIEFIIDYTEHETQCCDGEWADISDEALATFDRMATNLGLDRDLVFPSRTGDGFMGRGENINHESFADGDGLEEFQHWGISARADVDVFAEHTLTVVAATRRWDSDQNQENDELGANFSVFPNQIEDQKTYSLEARLASPQDQFFTYLVGAFIYDNDSDFVQQSRLLAPLCLYSRNTEQRVASGAIPDTTEGRSGCEGWWRHDSWTQEWTSLAVFAEATFNFTEQFDVSVGLRATRDDKEAEKDSLQYDAQTPQNDFGANFGTSSFVDDVDNTETTWSATARYFFEESPIMLFARVAKGYKSPGINARPIRFDTIPRTFGPEESINVEVGMKSLFWNDRALLNLTLYQNNFEDLQQIAANPQADPTGALGTFVQNAGELEHKGVELEYQLLLTDWLTVSGSAAYLDSEYKEFRGTPCARAGFHDVPADPINPALCDQTGLPATYAPELRHNTTIAVRFPLGDTNMEWFAQWSAIYTDELDTAADKDIRAFRDELWLHDVAFGIDGPDDKWEIRGWVKNATDREYIYFGVDSSVSGNIGTRGSFFHYLGNPRTYGLDFTYNL